MNKEEIISICEKYGIKNYNINDDGSINVDGDVDFVARELTRLPLKFRYVTGHFKIEINSLTTLQGCPTIVGRSFFCNYNKLSSLEFSPKEVGGNFNCHGNKLLSLAGSPMHISGDFNCFDNMLISLTGSPITVDGDFYAYNNNINTLIGASREVQGVFHVGGNKLNNLIGIPLKVGSLYIDDTLTSTFSGYEDCEVRKSVLIINQEPSKFQKRLPRILLRHENKLPIILKYQRFFEIWNEDFSLHPANFDEFLDEIEDGLF